MPDAPLAAPPVTMDAAGRLVGVDGVLNQVAGAVAAQAARVLLPPLQADRELQRTIGAAAGRAIYREARPVVWTVAGAILATCGVLIYRAWRPAADVSRP